MTPYRQSLLLATGAVVACAVAVVVLWMILGDLRAAATMGALPSVLALMGLGWAIVRNRPLLFLSTGALLTYFLLGLWSGGLYFGPGAFCLILAAVVAPSRDATPPRNALVATSLWCLLGITGLCAAIFVRAKATEYHVVTATGVSEHHIDMPGVIEVGAAIFPALLVGLIGVGLWRSLRRLRSGE